MLRARFFQPKPDVLGLASSHEPFFPLHTVTQQPPRVLPPCAAAHPWPVNRQPPHIQYLSFSSTTFSFFLFFSSFFLPSFFQHPSAEQYHGTSWCTAHWCIDINPYGPAINQCGSDAENQFLGLQESREKQRNIPWRQTSVNKNVAYILSMNSWDPLHGTVLNMIKNFNQQKFDPR